MSFNQSGYWKYSVTTNCPFCTSRRIGPYHSFGIWNKLSWSAIFTFSAPFLIATAPLRSQRLDQTRNAFRCSCSLRIKLSRNTLLLFTSCSEKTNNILCCSMVDSKALQTREDEKWSRHGCDAIPLKSRRGSDAPDEITSRVLKRTRRNYRYSSKNSVSLNHGSIIF